jgi:hypothetical protein
MELTHVLIVTVQKRRGPHRTDAGPGNGLLFRGQRLAAILLDPEEVIEFERRQGSVVNADLIESPVKGVAAIGLA